MTPLRKLILIVEDDAVLARALRDNLAFDGFNVECVPDADQAIARTRERPPDLVLLDLMLPGRDGFDVCGILRQGGRTPVIILSARSQKVDKVRGLDLGADDYITKPFELDELLARIHAVLRRSRPEIERLSLGTITIDFRRCHATVGRRELHLTHREFEVLQYLAERQERVVNRVELLREIWGYVDMPSTRSVDHAIARLRRKIEADPHNPQFIQTVHGDGYRLSVSPEAGTREP